MTDTTYHHDLILEAKLCAMIVSNPGGSPRPQAWQKRVNDLIRAQSKAIAELRDDHKTLCDGRQQQEETIQCLKRERDAALRQNRALEAAVSAHQSCAMPGTIIAAQDVLAERARQVNDEGWTPEHDDAHICGELAQAAAVYALLGTGVWSLTAVDYLWPRAWAKGWLKYGHLRRMLVKAAALIIAEIERLDRATSPEPSVSANIDPRSGCSFDNVVIKTEGADLRVRGDGTVISTVTVTPPSPTPVDGETSADPVGTGGAVPVVDAAEKNRRKAVGATAFDRHEAERQDAEAICCPCKLCGGRAQITDAGEGSGYYIQCENVNPHGHKKHECIAGPVRISGWAYNVADLWNRLNNPTE